MHIIKELSCYSLCPCGLRWIQDLQQSSSVLLLGQMSFIPELAGSWSSMLINDVKTLGRHCAIKVLIWFISEYCRRVISVGSCACCPVTGRFHSAHISSGLKSSGLIRCISGALTYVHLGGLGASCRSGPPVD